MHHRDDDDEDDGARGGALVEEAKRLMGEDQMEEAPSGNAGPKIKMGRLGKRGKKAAPGKESTAAASKTEERAAPTKGFGQSAGGSGPTGGFTEKDIEFMKKAIQVLC